MVDDTEMVSRLDSGWIIHTVHTGDGYIGEYETFITLEGFEDTFDGVGSVEEHWNIDDALTSHRHYVTMYSNIRPTGLTFIDWPAFLLRHPQVLE